MNVDALAENLQIADALTRVYAKRSLRHFLAAILVPAGPEPHAFGRVAEPWQREILAPMIPAFEGLAGLASYSGPSSFMQILARGHNKSSQEAWLTLWLLFASARTIKGYILAADREQGEIILQSAADCVRLNPWLAEDITIGRNTMKGPAGFIQVLPADVGSMYGLQGNLYICDEIVHWPKEGPWISVYTGRRKVRPNVFVVMSNAGLIDSWQHKLFVNCQADEDWVVFHQEGTLAGWKDLEEIERDRLLLPPSEGDRLFGNRWIDPSEEHDYLRRSEVEACEKIGRTIGLFYHLRGDRTIQNYVASIDYGPKKDRTALSVVHADADGVIRVDKLDVWARSGGKNVQVHDVEQWIEDVNASFRPKVFVMDNYQMEGTAQWCENRGIPVERFAFRAGAGNFELAQALRMLVADQRLTWYPGAGRVADGDTLATEMIGLRVKRMQYGFRFDHENQKHDDRAFAVGIAALRALEYPWAESIKTVAAPPSGPLMPAPPMYAPPGRR